MKTDKTLTEGQKLMKQAISEINDALGGHTAEKHYDLLASYTQTLAIIELTKAIKAKT